MDALFEEEFGMDEFCMQCDYWEETSDGYGICKKKGIPDYGKKVNAMDSCGNH